VFCKKCKHFLSRHTAGDRFCVVPRPVPLSCRAPHGRAAVRSPVQRAPGRASSGRGGVASPWWPYGALSWLPGAGSDLHERSGCPHLRGDRRRAQGGPHRSPPAERDVSCKQRAVGLRSMRRYGSPAGGARAHDPSGGERAGGGLGHRPRGEPVGPLLAQGTGAGVADRRPGKAAQARAAAGPRASARSAGRPSLGARGSAVF
jgi:hypothetical protein